MIDINTAIYVRVSTDEQANNGYSIRAQKEKLIAYAKIKEWNVYSVYSDDGISGKNIKDRPEILRLIMDVKMGNVSNVLVYKIDRLTRSTKDLIELVELFNNYDCSFNSFSEAIDTKSSTGRMFIKIIGIFAEFERENIAERVKLGLERKVKEGYTIASKNLSYGYIRKRGNKVQEIDIDEALVVKKIFYLFTTCGKTYTEIANYLNSNKIKTKNGNDWSYKTVKLLLSNPNYVGNVRYGINTCRYFEINGRHNSIISLNQYNLASNRIKHYSSNESLIFYNKIFCSCGCKMNVKKYSYCSKKSTKISNYIRYVCANGNCPFKSVSEKILDGEFYKFFSLNDWKNYSLEKKKKYIKDNVSMILVENGKIKNVMFYNPT